MQTIRTSQYCEKSVMSIAAIARVAAALGLIIFLAGCGGMKLTATVAPVHSGSEFHGLVHGGQQPVVGASIALYVASATGYGADNVSVLNAPTYSDSNGNFVISGDYNCTAGQQMYIAAAGGNPGGGTNPNIALLAALGDCANLSSATHIEINEVTTVGSVFALAPFMKGVTQLGSSSTNIAGLQRAFLSVGKLVNVSTGLSPGPALPEGAAGPSTEINALANVVASCINSTGGVAGDGTACGTLFSLTTPAGRTPPTDTVQATLAVARNPTQNVAAIFALGSAAAPFQPKLAAAPADWTMAITYTGAQFSNPRSTAIDAAGNIWVANAGNQSISAVSQAGNPLHFSPLTENGLATPAAIAIDQADNVWVANSSGNSVSAFSSTGSPVSGSPFFGSGTLNKPNNLSIDGTGAVWLTNAGSNTVVELSPSGSYVQQITNDVVSAPTGIVINPH